MAQPQKMASAFSRYSHSSASLPQSAALTAPSSEGATQFGKKDMRTMLYTKVTSMLSTTGIASEKYAFGIGAFSKSSLSISVPWCFRSSVTARDAVRRASQALQRQQCGQRAGKVSHDAVRALMMTHRVLVAVCIVCEPVLARRTHDGKRKNIWTPLSRLLFSYYCVELLRYSIIVVCRPIAACGGLPSYVSCNLMNGIVR